MLNSRRSGHHRAAGWLLTASLLAATCLAPSLEGANAITKPEKRAVEVKKVDGEWRFVAADGRGFALTALMGVARQDPTLRPTRDAWEKRINNLLDDCGFLGLGSNNDSLACRLFKRPYLIAASSAPVRLRRLEQDQAPQSMELFPSAEFEDPWGAPLDVWNADEMGLFTSIYGQRVVYARGDSACVGFMVDDWRLPVPRIDRWEAGCELLIRILRQKNVNAPGVQAARDFLMQTHKQSIKRLNRAWKTDYAGWDELLNDTECGPDGLADLSRHAALCSSDSLHRPDIPEGYIADSKAFASLYITNYFKATTERARGVASAMPLLSPPLSAQSEPAIIQSAAEIFDVVTIAAEGGKLAESLRTVAAIVDAPVYLTGVSFRGADMESNVPILHDAPLLKDQQARAETAEKAIRAALAEPNCVGYEWDGLSDGVAMGGFVNTGVINRVTQSPNEKLAEALGRANAAR